MKHALESIVVLKNMGVRFTPTLKTAFRAFEECPWRDLKVVFLGSDTYAYPGIADGLAFSCSNKGFKPDKIVTTILDQVKETYGGAPYNYMTLI